MSEQILKEILNEIKYMKTDIVSIKTGQSAIEQQLIAFQQFTMEQFSKIDDKFTGLENKVTATNVIIENDIKPSVKVITEQLDYHSRSLQFNTSQLDRIEDKVTHHDIRISILDKTKSNKRIAKVK